MEVEVSQVRGLLRRTTAPAEAGSPEAAVASICVGFCILKATLRSFPMRARDPGTWAIPAWKKFLLYPVTLKLKHLVQLLKQM